MYEIASFGPKEYRINVTYTLIITPSKIGLGLGLDSVVEGIKAHLLTQNSGRMSVCLSVRLNS